MPSDRVAEALRSIELHTVEASLFMEGMTQEQFRVDRRTFHAVTRCLEIISEATRRLSDEVRSRHPALPWRDIADAGNVYGHDYDNVAADFVYKTATQDLAALLVMARGEQERSPP
jgi:uncharacterized protein with HEPN domain